jgi:uncharacterized protein YjbI with pentapeptide repeats
LTKTVSLFAIDEPTKLSTPGYPWPTATADASDTATVTYTDPKTGELSPVTAAEGALGVYDEKNEATPNCDSPFNPPTTTPPPPPANAAISGNNFVSSGTFPLGDTKLACNASDSADDAGQPGENASTSYFHVIVTDPPATLTVPPTQLARAASSSGATVNYVPSAVTAAENGEADTPICSADKSAGSSDNFVSGGTFPVGGTTVTCTATLNDDGTTPDPQTQAQSFTVIVTKTPCAALAGCNLHGLDLSGVNLAGTDMSDGTDLSDANLDQANLSCTGPICANLTNANLSGANLNLVDLTGANLTGANLTGANLRGANLTGANLTGANLTGANLNGAVTTGATFDQVIWSNTTCPDGTLSSASTPETCVGHL